MKLFKIIITISVTAAVVISSCSKPQEGYLSKVLTYSPKTLVGSKGRVTVSAALIVDGSTSPINVKLLQTRNFYSKQNADSILLKKYEIVTYKAEITQNDSTVEQVQAKLGKELFPSFRINPIGGRLELTPATNFIDTGTYEFDVKVDNPAGSRDVSNVGLVRIVNPTSNIDITSQSVSTSPVTSETTTNQTNFTLTVVRTAATDNKVIFKFVDKNGVAFNPKNTQVNPRPDRPSFRTHAPFYAEEKTDTALVYRYPTGLPTFPIYPVVTVAGANYSYLSYYRIPASATDIGLNINPVIGFRLWPLVGSQAVSGTYLVTFKMNFVAKK